MNCPICNKEMLEFPLEDSVVASLLAVVRRCNKCSLTYQKLPVRVIIDSFYGDEIDRYLKLVVLNMVNELPINDLFEFWIAGNHALTIEEFDKKLKQYKNKQDSLLAMNLIKSCNGRT